MLTLPFPVIDPVLVHIGPFAIRWYALAYVVSLIIGWRYTLWLAKLPPGRPSRLELDDFLLWATLGVVLGGRIGYILFYQPDYYFSEPLKVFFLWQGGMSFHGGLIGVILAMILFAWRRKLPFFVLADVIAAATPIGLFLGRIANFINGELFGRASDVPWAMVFPRGGPEPRHPSQLYEAGLEGIILFLVLFTLARFTKARLHPGIISGAFLIGYGASRFTVELFRQPDPQLGFLMAGATMGQLLSLPMVAFGLGFIVLALVRR